ncbi:hypothetical protein C8R44DRAFT_762668, partial [Mycena epipterygia]
MADLGQLEEALSNSQKATELFRTLVSLAPRHLPSLASSLRNFASILWNVGRRDESVAACVEATSIMRDIADTETHFLGALAATLDQLAGCLLEKGDINGASAATAECAEVRRKIAALPAQKDLLFLSEVEMDEKDDLEDENKLEDEAREPATQSDEYHDPATDIEAVVSGISSRALPSTTHSESTESQFEPSGMSIATEEKGMSSIAAQGKEKDTLTSTVMPRQPNVLSIPLEVSLRLSTTPVDMAWWMLLGILSVGFAVLWNRV